jgi:hypothetical protein
VYAGQVKFDFQYFIGNLIFTRQNALILSAAELLLLQERDPYIQIFPTVDPININIRVFEFQNTLGFIINNPFEPITKITQYMELIIQNKAIMGYDNLPRIPVLSFSV